MSTQPDIPSEPTVLDLAKFTTGSKWLTPDGEVIQVIGCHRTAVGNYGKALSYEWRKGADVGVGVFYDEAKLRELQPVPDDGPGEEDGPWAPGWERRSSPTVPVSSEETRFIAVPAYRDPDGNPTCAADFQAAKICPFLRTFRFGTAHACALSVDLRAGLRTSKDHGEGFLQPDLSCCPVWRQPVTIPPPARDPFIPLACDTKTPKGGHCSGKPRFVVRMDRKDVTLCENCYSSVLAKASGTSAVILLRTLEP